MSIAARPEYCFICNQEHVRALDGSCPNPNTLKERIEKATGKKWVVEEFDESKEPKYFCPKCETTHHLFEDCPDQEETDVDDEELLNYCVGIESDYRGGKYINIYSYHSQIHYGTMKEAEDFKKYVLSMSNNKDKEKYEIFKLVRV